jgi:hypothetical protein
MKDVTEQDVHRVALDEDGRRWKILTVKFGAVCAYCDDIYAMRMFGYNGMCRTNHANLIAWDLDTIPGEKRWWLVARNVTKDEIIDIHFGQDYDQAEYMMEQAKLSENVDVLGLIYDVHYAGYPVGTIHTLKEMR